MPLTRGAMPMATQLEVPTISLDRDPAAVGREIDEVLRTVGFFQVVDHGVSDAVADRCWQLTRAFFDLPLDDKMPIARAEGGQFGYFPMLAESLANSLDAMDKGDLKESLNVSGGLALGHTPVDATEASLFAVPRWPEALPGLQPAWQAYIGEMRTLADRLLSIFALGLGLPAEYFADKVDRAPVSQRAINYPEQDTAPDEGVLLPDTDAAAGLKLRLGGAALRRIDVALLAALGVERVMVRQPRARVVCETAGTVAASAAALIASAIDAEGGSAITQGTTLEAALSDDTADAVVAIGGTGSGRSDSSVKTLARLGKVTCHGVAIAPGETTAIGAVGARPVLLLPGRADAALAGWLTIGRRMLARLAFRLIEDQPFAAELGRKVTSSLGLAEVVPVRRRLARVEPVAAGYLPLQSLIKAEGWILVPADSEGYPQGARVVVRPWP